MSFLKKLFGFEVEKSKEVAKKRLQLLLIHDQVNLTPTQLENMKRDIVSVIEQYLQVDSDDTHVMLDRLDNQIRLVSSIPMQETKRRIG